MDDHLFDRVWTYGLCSIIPRFQNEYKTFSSVKACPSYYEVVDFCKVLNLLQKWDFTRRDKTPFTPSYLLSVDC